ncbi:hypothetical protein NQ317_013957 [Molorchus minor]|uniref:Uncharacterized protein n=1 Tax=Molorchus minor TaxID=1323400 RepID=A0ABQ9JWT9_9CUCU|nr:hypothetical protein NQ317_013957 [Molorchus minor]
MRFNKLLVNRFRQDGRSLLDIAHLLGISYGTLRRAIERNATYGTSGYRYHGGRTRATSPINTDFGSPQKDIKCKPAATDTVISSSTLRRRLHARLSTSKLPSFAACSPYCKIKYGENGMKDFGRRICYPEKLFGGGSVTVWGGIMRNGRTDLVVLEGEEYECSALVDSMPRRYPMSSGSPDGIFEDGIIEIKCPISAKTYIKII